MLIFNCWQNGIVGAAQPNKGLIVHFGFDTELFGIKGLESTFRMERANERKKVLTK